MATLELKSIGKRFGRQTVIDKLSLSIEDGEFVVLVGPSGCGKSTLLRMIAGLEDITSGDLLIDGQVSNRIPPQRRDISMVFQSYALFPHMSVRDNIAFGPEVRGENAAETARRIDKASRVLNLSDYLDRKPVQLSGGQRQRVAMGRAIVRDPKVFLFDEPLSNLDAKLRVQMRTEIKSLHQKLGTTIVYVTHDQIEAMTMADRIVVMNDGVIEQAGTPLELYDRPASRFVASFIGSPSMGFMNGIYEDSAGQALVRLADGTCLPVSPCRLGSGAAVTIGIRPECFRRDAQGPLTFDVAVVEPTGPEIHVFGHVGESEIRTVFRDRDLPAAGTRLSLSVDARDVHVFEYESGRRLVS
ncbi:ABC transporter ATP-binding protein [Granulosicoccus sp. 3-233]|uniref:ABC transporter ATP-binding protein n=1 Tax=Granulosicoccus sp. 3-233 TaxID=3417969 RepID=UPI003D34CE36